MKKKPKKSAAKRKTNISPQWEKVQRFRDLLSVPEPPPEIRRLRDAWSEIEPKQPPLLGLESCGSPIEALNFCTSVGYYPPPEILLAVDESWNEYLVGATARATLETALIGKPVRKAGNFSTQRRARLANMNLALVLLLVQRDKGFTQEDAAEFAISKYRFPIEPETMIRRARTAMTALPAIKRSIPLASASTLDSAAARARSFLAKSAK